MIEAELKKIKGRANFYRNAFRSMVGALLFMLLITIGLIVVLAYQIVTTPEPDYYASSNDGRLISLTPLNTPALAQAELLQWAARVAVEAYNYDFVNYRGRLDKLRPYFTNSGYDAFAKSLQLSGTLPKVIDEKLRSSAVATGAPVILEQGNIAGHYAWKVQLPILVTYESASGATEKRNILVDLIITRVSTLETPKGIAITQFFSRSASPVAK